MCFQMLCNKNTLDKENTVMLNVVDEHIDDRCASLPAFLYV